MYRILVADDEINILEGLSDVLEQSGLGIQVVAKAKNGQEALDLFKKYSPDLVLIDINMPLLNGLECIEQFHKLQENVQVIIISSYDNFKYAQAAIELKVDAYILKPVDENQLIEIIKKCLRSLNQNMYESSILKEHYQKNHSPKSLIDYINLHYSDKDLNNEKIEKEFGLSRTSVFKIMKEITDKSLNEYITMIRIRQALSLLEKSEEISLKEIAEACGYSDQFYFSRVFKKQTGYSPSDYRKLISEDKNYD